MDDKSVIEVFMDLRRDFRALGIDPPTALWCASKADAVELVRQALQHVWLGEHAPFGGARETMVPGKIEICGVKVCWPE